MANEATDSDNDLIDTVTVSEMTPYKASTLKRWRTTWKPGGEYLGPPFLHVGTRIVRYRRGDVKQWLDGQVRPA